MPNEMCPKCGVVGSRYYVSPVYWGVCERCAVRWIVADTICGRDEIQTAETRAANRNAVLPYRQVDSPAARGEEPGTNVYVVRMRPVEREYGRYAATHSSHLSRTSAITASLEADLEAESDRMSWLPDGVRLNLCWISVVESAAAVKESQLPRIEHAIEQAFNPAAEADWWKHA